MVDGVIGGKNHDTNIPGLKNLEEMPNPMVKTWNKARKTLAKTVEQEMLEINRK